MKNKASVFKILAVLISILIYVPTYAQASENPATAEIYNQTGSKLLITAVNFKNRQNDWVELYYESANSQQLNIKGFEFQDDNVFKKVPGDYWLSSGQSYQLKFKDSDPDSQQQRLLTTARSGLTGTTEQIILKDSGGNIIDAVCWSSAKPTPDEIKDMQKLFQNRGWISADPASCYPSAKVTTNQSIVRAGLNDTNSVSDWSLGNDGTAAAQNGSSSTTSGGDNGASTASNSSNSDPTASNAANSDSSSVADSGTSDSSTSAGDSANEEPSPSPTGSSNQSASHSPFNGTDNNGTSVPLPAKTPVKKTATKKTSTAKKQKTTVKKATTVQKYRNGDTSPDVFISEFLPHPSKKQKENEWIEITNKGDQNVRMGNWKIGVSSKKKPYVLPDTIILKAKSAVVIKAAQSKISLNDSKGILTLTNPRGTTIQSISYEEPPKDQSYAWTTVQKEDGSAVQQWLWENTPTPGQINPPYRELTGTITSDASFDSSGNYSFRFKNSEQREYQVVFNEALIAGPLAKTTFTKETTIKILGAEPENPTQKRENNEPAGQSTQQVAEQNAVQSTGQQTLQPLPQSSPQALPPETIELKKFEVIKQADPQPAGQSSPWLLLGILPPAGAGLWFIYKKRTKSVVKYKEA